MNQLHIEQVGELFMTIDGFDFSSNQNLLEFDFIVIDVEELINSINDKWQKGVHSRFAQLIEFAKRKDIPVVFFATRHSEFILDVGTVETDLFECLNIEVDEIEMEGRKIEINPNNHFSNFFQLYATEFEYLVGFPSHPGTSVGSAKSKNISVGFYTKDFVYLPTLVAEVTNMDEDAFLNDLYQICRSIRKGDEVATVPDWTGNFLLPGEADERDTLNKIELEIQRLNKAKVESETMLATFLPLKQLWSGTGTTLERAAKLAFEELGFTILPAEPNRDDIIMTLNNQIIIVEVKGLTKSAGEKNAGQLEKWLGTYLSENGSTAKGILLVNAYREFPIDERTQAAFPAQMVPYATRRDQCLLTTIQLCTLLLHCRANPEEKDSIIQTLINTVGVYTEFHDWDQYLTRAKKSPRKKAAKK